MKNDDAFPSFSYHPAALHFRKGLCDRPVQVDRWSASAQGCLSVAPLLTK
jgi:hypothetical protein